MFKEYSYFHRFYIYLSIIINLNKDFRFEIIIYFGKKDKEFVTAVLEFVDDVFVLRYFDYLYYWRNLFKLLF